MVPSLPTFPEPNLWVSEEIIQSEFNNGKYWERLKDGEFIPVVHKDGHPTHPPKDHPPCTRSQFVIYCTPQGEPIAGVHQYLLPDGSIGGRGRPDPKRLVVGGQVLGIRAK